MPWAISLSSLFNLSPSSLVHLCEQDESFKTAVSIS
jgi:hypothetical protein